MSASVEWTGLDDLLSDLLKLADHLGHDVGPIVYGHARKAEQQIRNAYPVRTGDLKNGMAVETIAAGSFGAAARVVNHSDHAGVFESGTQGHHRDLGADRGPMPPGHIFVPIVLRERRAMYAEIKTLLRSVGFTVTGEVNGA